MCALRGRLAPAAVHARLRGQLVVSLPLSRLDTRRLQSGSFLVPHTGNERKIRGEGGRRWSTASKLYV